MASVNKVILMGNLGADPVKHTFADGTETTSFSIATTDKWKDGEGNKQERTEWHKCVAYGGLAKVCNQYLKKGSLIHIIGSLRTRDYEKEGVKHYVTEIVFDEMEMCDSKKPESKPAKPAKRTK